MLSVSSHAHGWRARVEVWAAAVRRGAAYRDAVQCLSRESRCEVSPLTWPILLPLWLRLDLQARWEGAALLLDLARGMARDELLKRLGAVDANAAVDELMEAHAQAGEAMMRVAELEKQIA